MSKHGHSASVKILVGLILGVTLGALAKHTLTSETQQWIIKYFTQPIGTAFLRGLFMVVVPLVFTSLTVSIAELGTVQRLGKLGWKLGIFYFCSTAIAVFIGQSLVLGFKPGEGIDPAFVESAKTSLSQQTSTLVKRSEGVGESLWPGFISEVIPKNVFESFAGTNMLGIIFFAVLLGVALLVADDAKSKTLLSVLSAVSDAMIKIVNWIMRIAPFAVGALVFNAVLNFDVSILGNVAKYVAIVILGYSLHFFGVYSLWVKFLARIPLGEYYRRMTPVFLTAFSTSSSNATLPTTIAVLRERFGVPEKITTFTAPLGATINMDGTALFEMVAAIFIAQVFGIQLSFTDHVTLIILIIVTSAGVGGIPGGSIPLLMSSMATVGIPAEGIALILGVDRLLDMGRTVLNVTCDGIAALYLARVEGVPLEEHLAKPETYD
jgi:dicarboxylate/amino acid:cation (Na+ or H+) symporter, DAACS family